jgi:hypothetical protein
MRTLDKVLRALTGGERGLDAGCAFLFLAGVVALAVFL